MGSFPLNSSSSCDRLARQAHQEQDTPACSESHGSLSVWALWSIPAASLHGSTGQDPPKQGQPALPCSAVSQTHASPKWCPLSFPVELSYLAEDSLFTEVVWLS